MARSDTNPKNRSVILSLSYGGRSSALRIDRWIGLAALGAAPFVAAWLLLTTVYIVYQDPLLGALMARQTSMQYAYEDQIAVLKSQLDRDATRGAADRQAAGATLDNLAALGARLERRAQVLEALVVASASKTAPANARQGTDAEIVGRAGAEDPFQAAVPHAAPLPSDASGYDTRVVTPQPTLPPDPPALRLEDKEANAATLHTGNSDDRLARSGEKARDRIAALETSFAALEGRQVRQTERLRDPVLRNVARLRTALAQAGIPAPPSSMGGPFVPLSTGSAASRFDEQAALLTQAIVLRDDLSRAAAHVPLRRPVEGTLEVTSPFGARLDPFLGRPALHTGIDLFDHAGDRVTATAAGVVTIAGADGGYGNMVEIDHGNGLVTRYAHLASVEVTAQQTVAAGALVGRVGATGRATGPHLHYETRIDGVPVDPSRFLKASFSLYPAE